MKPYLYQTVIIFASILVFSFTSCEKEDFYNTREEDQEEMSVLKREIDKLAGQFSCENASEWKFTPIGTKACGGAGAYIAYSTKIDEAAFLKKVALYTQKQNALNVKWGYISDCALVVAPKSVECVNGKPQFVY
jgi:hypothetical protein